MVDTFYDRIRQHDVLGPLFNQRIEDRWPEHLKKMYKFWGSILLGEHSYHGHPFAPHAELPIGKEHFPMWMSLFKETVTTLYQGQIADQAVFRAEIMAAVFARRLGLNE